MLSPEDVFNTEHEFGILKNKKEELKDSSWWIRLLNVIL